MALDFTVVIQVRQGFGDSNSDDAGQETQAPFVGRQKDYSFRCPNVDRRQQAILLLQCQGANVRQTLEINGQQIYGGIPASVDVDTYYPPPANPNSPPSDIPIKHFYARWIGNVMLVQLGVLQDENVLRIQAGEIGSTGNIDNFIVDNLVVVFKTRRNPGSAGRADVATQ